MTVTDPAIRAILERRLVQARRELETGTVSQRHVREVLTDMEADMEKLTNEVAALEAELSVFAEALV